MRTSSKLKVQDEEEKETKLRQLNGKEVYNDQRERQRERERERERKKKEREKEREIFGVGFPGSFANDTHVNLDFYIGTLARNTTVVKMPNRPEEILGIL